MKIAISGPANSGKTTLLKNFVNTFPMYATPAYSYRNELKNKNMGHSKNTSEETQTFILNYMINQVKELNDVKHIIFDRCPLDVLAYTIQAFQHNLVSEDFVSQIVEDVKEALSLYDIIFVLPYNENIKIEDNGTRETDLNYIKETNAIFENILHEYYTNFDAHDIFPEDCPGIILLDGENKMADIKALINSEGDLYSVEDDKRLQTDFAEAVKSEKRSKEMMEKLIAGQEALLPRIDISNLKGL